MNLVENIREGMRAINANMLRTILTALIIAIGITALVGILTAVDSIKHSLNSTMATLGASSFEIEAKGYSNRYSHGGIQGKVYPPITYDQASRYKERVSSNALVSISASVAGAVTVKAGNIKSNPNISVYGIDENYLTIENFNIDKGRQFSGSELQHGSQVVLIGNELAEMLFPKQNPVGMSISFLGKHYRVVGKLAKTGSSFGGGGADRVIYLPLQAGMLLPRQRALTYKIDTQITTPENLTYMMGEVTGLMRTIRQDRPGAENSFELRRSDSLSKTLDGLSGNLKTGGFIVGFITLLGAAIGLMNIMMVSVTERTKEIGVRKALGATKKQIRTQFLIEAIVICVLGGIAGIILGILLGNGVSAMTGAGSFIIPWLWITLGLAVCIVVGLVSGYYPAYRASQLDPIESLRYE